MTASPAAVARRDGVRGGGRRASKGRRPVVTLPLPPRRPRDAPTPSPSDDVDGPEPLWRARSLWMAVFVQCLAVARHALAFSTTSPTSRRAVT